MALKLDVVQLSQYVMCSGRLSKVALGHYGNCDYDIFIIKTLSLMFSYDMFSHATTFK